MHSFLRQSTASQSRALGPFVDDTDFKTPETGLTIANTDIKLVINGAASANKNSGGGTHRVNGVYGVTFDATDSATVGEVQVSVVVAGALPVFATFIVVEEAVYDALFAASAAGYGTAQTGDSFARLGAPAGASVSADVASVKVDTAATKVKTDFLPSATAGAAGGLFLAGSNAATSITTALTANLIGNVTGNLSGSVGSVTGNVGGNVTGSVGSVAGAVGSVTGNVGGNVAGSVASVTADVNVAAASVRTAVGLASANLDTQLAAIQADSPNRITKNVALAGFTFIMVNSSDHVTPATGLTITATRSLDGAAFAACTNSASEISDGAYKIDLAAADLNANTVLLRFTGSGADDRFILIATQPT